MSNAAPPESNVASYVLTLRSERPVEGCELAPNAFLQLKGGNLDNSGRAKLMDSKPFQYVFTWHRGPRGSICANQRCPRGHSFDPTHWSKAVVGGPHLICNVCLSGGKDGHDSSFCSAICFKDAWREHAQVHAQFCLAASSSPNDSDPQSPDTPLLEEESVSNGTSNANNRPRSQTSGSLGAPHPNAVPEGWTQVGAGKDYLPGREDVGCRLRVQVSALALADGEVLAGPVSIFTEVVLQAPSAPPKRNLLTLPGAQATVGAFRFRIISYNILAELFATKQAYPYCDSWSLSWPYRRAILLQELQETQGDVVCLQEVQADYYEQHILPFMSELGYEGLFLQKSRDFTGSYVKVDGCATFWRRSKFTQAESYSIEFNDIARQEVARGGLDDAEARKFMNRLSRDNVAQLVVLDVVKSTNPAVNTSNLNAARGGRTSVCVVNTHLYSNVQRADVKLWQTVHLLREVRQFVVPRDLPVLLCGDFNSEPESAVYEYLMNGMVNAARPELSESSINANGNGNGNVRILPDLHRLTHDLDLASVYSATLGREPDFTNYTARFKGCLDYIYFSPNRLRVVACAALPEEQLLQSSSGEGLPSAVYPSDHLMLCADVCILASGNGSILNTDMSSRQGSVQSVMRAHGSSNSLSLSGASTPVGGVSGGAGSGSAGSAGISRGYGSTSSLNAGGIASGGGGNGNGSGSVVGGVSGKSVATPGRR